jgi:CcmD family protein
MDTRNFTFMFYGFLAAWLIVVAYIVSLASREKRIRRELDGLRALLEERQRK